MDETVAITTVFSFAALIAAIFIPRRVMVNQIYANLIADYRTPEMGEAILALFHFYKKDCKCKVSKIEAKYRKRYKKEVKPFLKKVPKVDTSNALHFQRRMVTQFYFNMAVLRFKHCFLTRLSLNKMKTWFTMNDLKLLSLILHMAEPAKKVFIEVDSLSEPPNDDVPMNNLIRRLYDEVKRFK